MKVSDILDVTGGDDAKENKEKQETSTEKDTLDVSGTKKDEQNEEADKLILGKFKSQEELQTAYKELESKIGGGQEDLSKFNSDALADYFKKHYGKYEFKSSLEGELGEISKELAEKTGVPAPLADYMTTQSVNKIVGKQAKVNVEAVTKMFEDGDTRDAFIAGAEAAGLKLDEVTKRLKSGQISAAEAKGFAAIGKKHPEAKLTETKKVPKENQQKLLEEYNKLTEVTANNPYYQDGENGRPKHKRHLETVKRVNEIRHKLGI